jgi:hypothetical protein
MPMYARGSIAWGLCQRCGLRYLLKELVMDGYYPNIRVCQGCYDPPQPQERLAVVSDPLALFKPAVDTVFISPPVLVANVVGVSVALTWSGFNGDVSGDIYTGNYVDGPIRSGGAQVTAGYLVNRSPDGLVWTQLANLANTADEFGALSIETRTYTDTPPGFGPWFYQVTGYDAVFFDTYG